MGWPGIASRPCVPVGRLVRLPSIDAAYWAGIAATAKILGRGRFGFAADVAADKAKIAHGNADRLLLLPV